nr:gag pol polyprotein [Hymenolepis microstoma]
MPFSISLGGAKLPVNIFPTQIRVGISAPLRFEVNKILKNIFLPYRGVSEHRSNLSPTLLYPFRSHDSFGDPLLSRSFTIYSTLSYRPFSYSLRMYPETDLGFNACDIYLDYSTFNPEYLDTFFLQLEMGFQLSDVIKQRMMFRHAITALPSLSPFCLQELFALVKLGYRSPSQLLSHMRPLASSCELDNAILKELRLTCLLKNVKSLVIKRPIQDELDILREMDDCIHKVHNRPDINVVKTSAHVVSTIERQKLDTAEPIKPNCQQSSTMVNPMEEIDTELVQTETRYLFKELPNLADDSSSIHEDIQNLLPEHSKISIMKRNKHKRKVEKQTAAN